MSKSVSIVSFRIFRIQHNQHYVINGRSKLFDKQILSLRSRIYIWLYIQHLYHSKEKKHHRLFDKVFKNVYDKSLSLDEEKPEFFNKYPIERLVDTKHNYTKRRGK